ncbi:hypothetical protein VTH82DRAFT_5277 [Thermothelomyces myriococcoides]
MQVGLRPRLRARPSLVDLLVRAGGGTGGQSPSADDPPHAAAPAKGTAAASSPPLFSAGTYPVSDRDLELLAGVLEQAANLPLPPSPDIPPVCASAPPSPTPISNNNIPSIVINPPSASAPSDAAATAIASSPRMAPVSSHAALFFCLAPASSTLALGSPR